MSKGFTTIILGMVLTVFFLATGVEAREVKSNSLDDRQKSIALIAAFTASGDLVNLKSALSEGLEAGMTVNEINEVLVQMYAYCGFPRSLNGINTFMALLDERKAAGINDTIGPQAQAMPDNLDKNRYGEVVRQKLFGLNDETPLSPYQVFSPVIDDFLKEHLFADIFYRDILSYLDREIATVAALANMSGTNPQLKAHMGAAMNTGLSQAQMLELIQLFTNRIGKMQGDNATSVFRQVMSSQS